MLMPPLQRDVHRKVTPRFRDGGSVDARKDAALFRDEVETGFQRRVGKVSWLRGRADLWNTRDGLLVSHSRSRALVEFPAVRFRGKISDPCSEIQSEFFRNLSLRVTAGFWNIFATVRGSMKTCQVRSRNFTWYSVYGRDLGPPTLFETKTQTLQKWPKFWPCPESINIFKFNIY